jgi:hypothetical protein
MHPHLRSVIYPHMVTSCSQHDAVRTWNGPRGLGGNRRLGRPPSSGCDHSRIMNATATLIPIISPCCFWKFDAIIICPRILLQGSCTEAECLSACTLPGYGCSTASSSRLPCVTEGSLNFNPRPNAPNASNSRLLGALLFCCLETTPPPIPVSRQILRPGTGIPQFFPVTKAQERPVVLMLVAGGHR